MKLGLWVTAHHSAEVNLGQVFRDLLEQVRLARQLGFGCIASGQHYLTAPYQRLQTFPLLARLAAEAEGMEVITSVVLLPLHNPVDIAEQAATMDVITGCWASRCYPVSTSSASWSCPSRKPKAAEILDNLDSCDHL